MKINLKHMAFHISQVVGQPVGYEESPNVDPDMRFVEFFVVAKQHTVFFVTDRTDIEACMSESEVGTFADAIAQTLKERLADPIDMSRLEAELKKGGKSL